MAKLSRIAGPTRPAEKIDVFCWCAMLCPSEPFRPQEHGQQVDEKPGGNDATKHEIEAHVSFLQIPFRVGYLGQRAVKPPCEVGGVEIRKV